MRLNDVLKAGRNRRFASFAHIESTGTDGGQCTSVADPTFQRTLNTTIYNGLPGVSLSSNGIVLDTTTEGTYIFEVQMVSYDNLGTYFQPPGSPTYRGHNNLGDAQGSHTNLHTFYVNKASGVSQTVYLQQFFEVSRGTQDMGRDSNLSTYVEKYATVHVYEVF